MKTVRQIGSIFFVVGLFIVIFMGLPWYVIVADNPAAPWWFKLAVFSLLGGILLVLLTLALEQSKKKSARDSPLHEEPEDRILLLNSDSLPGHEITDILGLVQGHTVYAIWLGKDLSAIIRLILGGELTEYTEMMGSARTTALQRMTSNAEKMGADAVINVRYMTTSVIGSAAELLVYGTAVKLKSA